MYILMKIDKNKVCGIFERKEGLMLMKQREM